MKTFAELKTVKHEPLADRIPLPGPLAVFIEFTNRCNFRCSFCPESLPDYAAQAGGLHKLSRTLFSKVCDELLELGGVKVVRFYGLGETLLHPDAPEMIAEAVKKKISLRTELTTNGSMLTRTVSRRLVRSGLDYVRVSVYGTNSKNMREFTQSPIPLSRIMDNLIGFKIERTRADFDRPFLYAKMVTEDQNEAVKFRNLFENVVDELAIESLHNWTGEVHLTNVTRPVTKFCCPAPFYMLKINADGLVNCCDADWRKETVVGNVAEETLKEIWNGERMRAFRLMHLEHRRGNNPACANCDFIHSFPDNIDSLTPAVLG